MDTIKNNSYTLKGSTLNICPNSQIHARENVLAKNSHTATLVDSADNTANITAKTPIVINFLIVDFLVII